MVEERSDDTTDEFILGNAPVEEMSELAILYPRVSDAYGLALNWSWEMKTLQGYFDAVQMEFTHASLKNSVTFQFKVAASAIWIFRVTEVRMKGR